MLLAIMPAIICCPMERPASKAFVIASDQSIETAIRESAFPAAVAILSHGNFSA